MINKNGEANRPYQFKTRAIESRTEQMVELAGGERIVEGGATAGRRRSRRLWD